MAGTLFPVESGYAFVSSRRLGKAALMFVGGNWAFVRGSASGKDLWAFIQRKWGVHDGVRVLSMVLC